MVNVGLLFPGVVIEQWTPPEDEEEKKVAYVSYVSSVGPGSLVVKMPEYLMLPIDYRLNNGTRLLSSLN